MPLQVAECAAAYGQEADSGASRGGRSLFCNVCSHQWREGADGRRFRSLDDLIKSTGLRRDEVTVLAEVGALNSLGYDRRSALWQVERAVRPAGELFAGEEMDDEQRQDHSEPGPRAPSPEPRLSSPLPEMSAGERLVADYAGTGLTVGPHPMRFRRHELSMKGVLRAIDLPLVKSGRRVRTAGMVITRQRPGTAKGFVFLTLEDETGISNVIIRPDVYARDKAIVVESPFLLVEGWLQIQEGVTAIKAERLQRLEGLLASMAVESHDFR